MPHDFFWVANTGTSVTLDSFHSWNEDAPKFVQATSLILAGQGPPPKPATNLILGSRMPWAC